MRRPTICFIGCPTNFQSVAWAPGTSVPWRPNDGWSTLCSRLGCATSSYHSNPAFAANLRDTAGMISTRQPTAWGAQTQSAAMAAGWVNRIVVLTLMSRPLGLEGKEGSLNILSAATDPDPSTLNGRDLTLRSRGCHPAVLSKGADHPLARTPSVPRFISISST